MRSLSILIGLALIATAIYLKPMETISCTPSQCTIVKGKYLIELVAGKLNIVNTETATVTRRHIKKLN